MDRKIVGWTALQFPWDDRPLKGEELAIVNSHDMPPGIEGLNMEALATLIESITFAGEHGYDPQTDYRELFSSQSLSSARCLIASQIEKVR